MNSCRGTAAALALVAALAVSGCSPGSKPKAAVPQPSPISVSPGGLPDALIGMWQVTGAAGEPADSLLRLSAGDAGGLILFRKCGDFTGDWQASTGGAFVALLSGYAQACMNTVSGSDITPRWLADARAFRVRGAERDLLAANATITARFTPVKAPQDASPGLIESLRQPPNPDQATIKKLRAVPQPLPSGAASVRLATLTGTWVPYPIRPYRYGKKPSVTFRQNGSWSASDGCNGTYGVWTLDPGGVLVTTAGPSTLIGCDGAPTAGWVIDARRAAVSGKILSLYDGAGRLVARLTR